MKLNQDSIVCLVFLLLSPYSKAHSNSHTNNENNNNNNNGPLFGNVMRYYGESETGYGLPSSGLFEDVDQSSQQQKHVSMCLPNFEVSAGSIIRTKDSQALGAHYLNETDLGSKSRDECLKLCCKVPRCNVAVFEEKNSGSCYLFDCGSLEDFRCKFTSQSHYVSAILRRREVVAQQQQNPEHSSNTGGAEGSIMSAHINDHSHNQHEDELSQLRDSDKTSNGVASIQAVPPAAAVSSSSSSTISKPDVVSSSKTRQSGTGLESTHGSNPVNLSTVPSPVGLVAADGNTGNRRCSRWQFECKSSGECIAIYNVCDAIPNCPDGSDESPELHCPVNNAYPAGVGDGSLNYKQKSSSTMSNHQQSTQASQQQNHHPQPPVPINAGLDKANTLNRNGNGAIGGSANQQVPLRQSEDYPQIPRQQQTLGSDGPASMMNIPRKNDPSLNIFSHKNGGIMENDAYGTHQQQQPLHSYGQYWPKQSSQNYDYPNGETSNMYGPLPPPPQYSTNGMSYGNSGNYGNGPYQFGSGYNNLQNPPQQSSQQQGLPMIPQGQSQYTGNSYVLPNNPQQPQQQQHLYYNSGQPVQGNNNNALVPPLNSDHGTASQAVNVQNSAGALPPQVQNANVINPSNPQALPPPIQQIVTNKPSGKQQGVQKSSNDNNSINKDNNSLSKLESEFIKSLKAQSFQSGSDIQAEELSPHTAGAGAVFIFILGLGMSVVMAIVVGCRLRRVGRRQRGKNRLDPDYLVDGMYL